MNERAVQIERVLARTEGMDHAQRSVLVEQMLVMLEKKNPQLFIEPVLELMTENMIGHVMLREFMLAKNLQAAMADSIKEPARELFNTDPVFRNNVISITQGIMKELVEHIYPVKAADLNVNLNTNDPAGRKFFTVIEGLAKDYGLEHIGTHVDDTFSRAAFNVKEELDKNEEENVS